MLFNYIFVTIVNIQKLRTINDLKRLIVSTGSNSNVDKQKNCTIFSNKFKILKTKPIFFNGTTNYLVKYQTKEILFQNL